MNGEKTFGSSVLRAGMGSKLPRLCSGFRQRALAPAKCLNFDALGLRLACSG